MPVKRFILSGDFERIHEVVYRESGFDLISIDRASLPERVAQNKRIVGNCV